MGHWASGMGHWALVIMFFLFPLPFSLSPSSKTLFPFPLNKIARCPIFNASVAGSLEVVELGEH